MPVVCAPGCRYCYRDPHKAGRQGVTFAGAGLPRSPYSLRRPPRCFRAAGSSLRLQDNGQETEAAVVYVRHLNMRGHGSCQQVPQSPPDTGNHETATFGIPSTSPASWSAICRFRKRHYRWQPTSRFAYDPEPLVVGMSGGFPLMSVHVFPMVGSQERRVQGNRGVVS